MSIQFSKKVELIKYISLDLFKHPKSIYLAVGSSKRALNVKNYYYNELVKLLTRHTFGNPIINSLVGYCTVARVRFSLHLHTPLRRKGGS